MNFLTHNNGGNNVENTLKAPWSSSPFIHQIQSSQTCGTKGGVDSAKPSCLLFFGLRIFILFNCIGGWMLLCCCS
ncbi:hypothetical protein CsSME_00012723 [Camellia sinensis var. sinensis]